MTRTHATTHSERLVFFFFFIFFVSQYVDGPSSGGLLANTDSLLPHSMEVLFLVSEFFFCLTRMKCLAIRIDLCLWWTGVTDKLWVFSRLIVDVVRDWTRGRVRSEFFSLRRVGGETYLLCTMVQEVVT